jgi:hypothetical protein
MRACFVMVRRLSTIVAAIGLALCALPGPVLAQKKPTKVEGPDVPVALDTFQSKSGQCTPTDLAKLRAASEGAGFTVTTAPAEVYVERGLSAASTGVTIPAMTGLRCHARDGDKLLVSIDDETSCGWIAESQTLGSKADPLAPPSIFTRSNSRGQVCGNVVPLSVKEFCQKHKDLKRPKSECGFSWVANSPFEAKFLVWNARSPEGKVNTESIQVPLYRSADAKPEDEFRKVKIFNVMQVFDIKSSPRGVRYLVGPNGKKMEGWIDQDAGAIWYSKLSWFFTKEADKPVLLKTPPASDQNKPLAVKPDNIADMLDGKKEFRRYPVLVDNRERRKDDPPAKQPHLETAFIGVLGGNGTMNVAATENGSPNQLDVLQRADIVFLVDATKSMEPYFGCRLCQLARLPVRRDALRRSHAEGEHEARRSAPVPTGSRIGPDRRGHRTRQPEKRNALSRRCAGRPGRSSFRCPLEDDRERQMAGQRAAVHHPHHRRRGSHRDPA